MTVDSKVFGRLRSQRGSGAGRGPREDEWFIPYKAKPSASIAHSGIGSSPAPVRHSSTNLLNIFSSSNSQDDVNRNYRIPHAAPVNPAVGVQRLIPQRPTVYRSPSHSSLIESIPNPARMTSSSSVPTGLVAPKMLFSPLSRAIRSGDFLSDSGDPISPPRRTVSPRPRRPTRAEQSRPRYNERRWAVSSMCNLFVLPRPQVDIHIVTPPDSPYEKNFNEIRIIQQGKERQQERDDWAELVKRRGRSMSFGGQAAPPGAPIIGNARARSRENSRNDSLATIDSRASRGRTESLGSRWSTRRRSTSRTRSLSREEKKSIADSSRDEVPKSFRLVNLGRHGSTGREFRNTSVHHPIHAAEVDNAGRARRSSDHATYHAGSHIHSDNEQVSNIRARGNTHDRPQRTLRIIPPPAVNRGGVVVIGPDAAESNARPPRLPHLDQQKSGEIRSQYQGLRPPFLDLSKPLPRLPQDRQSSLPDIEHFRPLSSEIGIAVSPEPVHSLTFAPSNNDSGSTPQTDSISRTPSDSSPTKARAYLAKQHQRALTKRAFQSPPHAPSAFRHPGAQESVTSAAFSSPSPRVSRTTVAPSSSQPIARRKTALEEAIGRSRAASVGEMYSSELHPVKFTLRARPRTAGEAEDVQAPSPSLLHREAASPSTIQGQPPMASPASPTFMPSPSLAYPIVTEIIPPTTFTRGAGAAMSFLKPERPIMKHADSAASGKTTYYDAQEGSSRSGSVSPLEPEPKTVAAKYEPQMPRKERDVYANVSFNTQRVFSLMLL